MLINYHGNTISQKHVIIKASINEEIKANPNMKFNMEMFNGTLKLKKCREPGNRNN